MEEVGVAGFGFGGIGIEESAAGGADGCVEIGMEGQAEEAAFVGAGAADDGDAAGGEVEKGGGGEGVIFNQADVAFVIDDEETIAGIVGSGGHVERLAGGDDGDGGGAEEVGLDGPGGDGVGELGVEGGSEEEKEDEGEDFGQQFGLLRVSGGIVIGRRGIFDFRFSILNWGGE